MISRGGGGGGGGWGEHPAPHPTPMRYAGAFDLHWTWPRKAFLFLYFPRKICKKFVIKFNICFRTCPSSLTVIHATGMAGPAKTGHVSSFILGRQVSGDSFRVVLSSHVQPCTRAEQCTGPEGTVNKFIVNMPRKTLTDCDNLLKLRSQLNTGLNQIMIP